MGKMTVRGFVKKFKDILVDGLDTSNSYVVLHRNKRLGIHLAIRPLIHRYGDQVIRLGGKVKVSFDDKAGPIGKKYAGLGYQELQQLLEETYTGLEYDKSSYRRVRVMAGVVVSAPMNAEKEFNRKVVQEAVEKLLFELGKKTGLKFGTRKEVERIRDALTTAYSAQLPMYFDDAAESGEGEVGKFFRYLLTDQGPKTAFQQFRTKLENEAQVSAPA